MTEPAPTATTTTATAAPMTYGTPGSVSATVAPVGSTGTVTVRKGATVLGTATLNAAGNAVVVILGTALEPGSHSLSVTYSGDATHATSSTTVTLVVNKAPSTTAATANPTHVTVGEDTSNITVAVTSGGGTPTGTVQAYVGGTLVDSGSLASGSATLTVGPFATVGAKTVTVRYLGDAHVEASQDTATVVVDPASKAVPQLGIRHTPNNVRAQQTRARLIVGVAADGEAARGSIRIRIPGTVNGVVVISVDLLRGRAEVRLPKFQVRGAKRIQVTYLGNATTARKVAFHTIEVLPKKK